MKIQLDMYQTLAVAVLVLLLGNYLKKKIYFLQKFCSYIHSFAVLSFHCFLHFPELIKQANDY